MSASGSGFAPDEIAALRQAGTTLAARIAIGATGDASLAFGAAGLYRRGVGRLWPDIVELSRGTTQGIASSDIAAPSFRLAVDGYLVRDGNLALGEAKSALGLASAFRADPGAFMSEIENGCCNLVAHDASKQTTIICSDGSGCLPLYLHRGRDRISLANDLPGLRAITGEALQHDAIGCAELYWFGYQIGERTLYRDVRCIPPGAILTIDWRSGAIDSRSWVTARRTAALPSAPAEAAQGPAALRETASSLIAAMQTACRRLRSPERHYGIKLSGGMDSRLIAGCWQAQGLQAFTYAAPGAVEATITQRLAWALDMPVSVSSLAGDFFSRLHAPLFEKFGIAEFFHQALTEDMTRAGIDCALDGMGGDVLFGGLALKRKGGPGAALRNALGLAPPPLGTGIGNDRAAELIFGQIRVGDANLRVLTDAAQAGIASLRDDVLADISRDYAGCEPGAAFERRYRSFAMRNRMRRYIALQGAVCRPEVETLYPFLDREVQALTDRIGAAQAAGKQFYRLLYRDNLKRIAGVPFVDSLLPPASPNWAHVLGRLARYGMETAGYRASLLLGRDLPLWRINSVQWPRWIGFDRAFVEGIGRFMGRSKAFSPERFTAAMAGVRRGAPVAGTRMMLTASYLGVMGPSK